MKKIFIFIIIYLIFPSVHSLELKGSFYQGNLILGKTEPRSKIYVDKKEVKISKEGFFVFGINKDRKNNIEIEIIKDKKKSKIIKKVYKKKYKVQRIEGLPKKLVTPPEEVYERIKNDNKLIRKASAIYSNFNVLKEFSLIHKDVYFFDVSKKIIFNDDFYIDEWHLSSEGASLIADELTTFVNNKTLNK